ncbi:hypothetical protein [Paeniglutamicibacter sp. NPDC091659]|uniref:hypothetical protein n=1 Tax=Paeniglutamicibacter sp. NPDC091659 TaxID=3364389 RepID=UPI00380AD7D4
MTDPFHEPASSGDSDDAIWEDLVRRLEEAPAAGPALPREPSPETGPGSGSTGSTGGVDPTLFRMHPALGGPRDYEAADDHEGFIPEDPPALGSGNPLLTLAWTAAAGAPLMLLILAIFWRRAPMPLWIGLCVVALAAGGFLFARLPRFRHEGDDGARV